MQAGLFALSCRAIHSGLDRRTFRLLFRIPTSHSLSPMQTYTKSIHRDARTQICVETHVRTLDARVGGREFVTAWVRRFAQIQHTDRSV